VLAIEDMIPQSYRTSGIDMYWSDEHGWSQLWDAWAEDEFALDPTRVTLSIGRTAVDGNTFKNKYLMDQYGIQVNKTSRNTVLFMTNIGTTRSSVAYLIEVLVKIARRLDAEMEDAGEMERKAQAARLRSLIEEQPDLPDFSRFHDVFRPHGQTTPAGDLRSAFFLAYDERQCEYFPLHGEEIDKAMKQGREVVSSGFIIPYPPGFPILVPGQVISTGILDFMRKLDVTEIHGYRAELGLRVFTEESIAALASE
jgi:arginine decarboxylase